MSADLVDELRAGAARLRLMADAARGGDWRAELLPPNEVHAHAAHWVTTEYDDGEGCIASEVVADCPWSQDDAAYIEAVQPRMGLAVADLVATAADLLESYPDLAQPHVEDMQCTDLACRVVHDALTVVRALSSGEENPDD